MSVVLGLVLAAGVLLVVVAVRPRGLQVALTSYGVGPSTRRTSAGRALHLASKVWAPKPSDLAVVERSLESFALERLVCMAVGSMLPIACSILIRLGGTEVPLVVTALMILVGGSGGLYLPVVTVHRSAMVARREFRTSLSAYLDLVSIMLAGGAGAETALVAAARIGSGRTFAVISSCLDVARSTRRSVWSVLAEEGERLGIGELPELAATIQLSGEQGARMTTSLVAKARSMRAKQLAEIEATANSSTERMGLPMVAMFMGFLVLLGYPAMHLIGQGFSG